MQLQICTRKFVNGFGMKYVGPVYHIDSYHALQWFIKQIRWAVTEPETAVYGWEKYKENLCIRFEESPIKGTFELYYGAISHYIMEGASILEVHYKQRSE